MYTRYLSKASSSLSSSPTDASAANTNTNTNTNTESSSTTPPNAVEQQQQPTPTPEPSPEPEPEPPIVHKAEGLCAVYKPLEWTSQDVVSYIRGMLERDARNRGVTLAKRRSRKSKKKIKVGHGGTLDPLATGVLVLGIGSGTKILTQYLSGSKSYTATGIFGKETNTLDLEGNVTKTATFDHITDEKVIQSLDNFKGKIMQIPPIYSAIKKNGKRLYESAREGKSEEDIVIDPREVEVYTLDYIIQDDTNGIDNNNDNDADSDSNEDSNKDSGLPNFGLSVQCGGGTYIRSLIRDIGYDLDSVATMTSLVRTQQGPFTLDDALVKDEWSADSIYAAVERTNLQLMDMEEQDDDDDDDESNDSNDDV